MSTTTEGNFITAEASADLHTNQYYIVTLNSTRQAALASAATQEIVGVLDEVPQGASGACSIAHVSGNGTGKVKAGTTFSKGAYLTADSTGRAVGTTTAGNRVFGRALEAAGAAGDVVEYEKMFFIY